MNEPEKNAPSVNEFSHRVRSLWMAELNTNKFDVIIIGGGITGAGIALDAASRGLNTLLIEQNDFASGTSSRSTKLIHGGLRYLKQLEFGLVKEVGSERAVIHRLAPHLVVPEKMLLPLYEKKGLGYWLTSIGLKIYDFLAGVTGDDQRKMLSRRQTLRYEPLLDTQGVSGGALYAEYRTDDARLTIETIKTAVKNGARCINYLEAIDFIYADGKVSAVKMRDHVENRELTVKAVTVVNAAGPWVDKLRSKNNSLHGKRLHLTKGVHVVLPAEKFPVRQAIYFDVPDGRMIFAIPRGRVTYVGTTDTNYEGDINQVFTTREDALYVLHGITSTFPTILLTLNDIESSWAGLRPLIHEEGKSASELSRKDEIFISESGLISIAGGKLTGFRKMAERVVNLIIKRSFEDSTLKKCFTDQIRLTPDSFKNFREAHAYQRVVRTRLPQDIPDETIRYLIESYGKQVDDILNRFQSHKESDAAQRLLLAELDFSIQHEMTISLEDFFVRRTGLLYFDIEKISRHLQAAASLMKDSLGWSVQECDRQVKRMRSLMAEVTAFKSNA